MDIATDITTPTPTTKLDPRQQHSMTKHYLLLEHITKNKINSIYMAEHALSKKKLTLKLVHPYLCHKQQKIKQFQHEMSTTTEINHPNIIQIYNTDTNNNNNFFITMKLLENKNLRNQLQQN